MRVKICGITSSADAIAAAEAGADAIGLNFVGGPRKIDPAQASQIVRSLPPFITRVALVRLEAGRLPDGLAGWLRDERLQHIQLYGEFQRDDLLRLERDGFLPLPVMRVADASFCRRLREWFPAGQTEAPAGIVLDAFRPGAEGGTGATFPWRWVADARKSGELDGLPPVVLAGGLHAGNVAEAIRLVRPYGVDVSSGVEVDGAPGKKDPARMRAFVLAAELA